MVRRIRGKNVLTGLGLLAFSFCVWTTANSQAQGPTRPPAGRRPGATPGAKKEDDTPAINDPKLAALHNEFVKKAEKLALDYTKGKDPDKARIVYEQILRLVPKHPGALAALDKLREKDASANRKTLDVLANAGSVDTGVYVIPGKPIHITAEGNWKYSMSATLGPDGFKIPDELKEFNLGALVGMIETGNPETSKPFLIGADFQFTAEYPGMLKLSMWDNDPSDNGGKLKVTIQGTFETKK